MSSIRDQIVQEVVDRLNDSGKPTNVEAVRYSLSKIDFVANPNHKPIAVYPARDTVERPRKGQPLLQRTLLLTVAAYSMGEPIDQGMDASLCWITSVLGSDASLGGLALDVRPVSEEWDEDMAIQGIGLCRSSWEIDYIHNRNNQENKP